MSTASQALFSPIWPLAKIGLKELASRLICSGRNPDAAPLLMFVFDSVSAMSASFLFLGSIEITSVLPMISIDIIENLVLSIRVIYNIQKYKDLKFKASKSSVYNEHQQKIRTMEIKIELLEKQMCEPVYTPIVLQSDTDIEADDDEDVEYAEKVELLEGEALVCMNQALRLLLNFLASEGSEIMSSFWALVMIPCFNMSQNKKFMYTFDVLSKANFEKAILFCVVDLVLEMLTFISMAIIIRITCDINVFRVLFGFARLRKIHRPMLAICCCITIAAFSFFMKHYGIDPRFKWDEFN
ncbi:hypothetical protein TrST_g6867 [Triparma strigata]|uniref:Uncharacterized protein n=1 Tax=Triparma strigata TaxID=1606541 RepID=A0A9W7ETD8_9STRA|nr:hypothetical protein TrST_g6867 [Triparma strigata]